MALWVLKGGRRGEREQRILDHSVVGIGWVELGDLSNIQTRKELEKLYRKTYTERLPDDIQAELPLKRIWALAASEIEE